MRQVIVNVSPSKSALLRNFCVMPELIWRYNGPVCPLSSGHSNVYEKVVAVSPGEDITKRTGSMAAEAEVLLSDEENNQGKGGIEDEDNEDENDEDEDDEERGATEARRTMKARRLRKVK